MFCVQDFLMIIALTNTRSGYIIVNTRIPHGGIAACCLQRCRAEQRMECGERVERIEKIW